MFVEGLDQGKRLAECLSKLRVNRQPPTAAPPVNTIWAGKAKGRGVMSAVLPLSLPQRSKRSGNEPKSEKETIYVKQLTKSKLVFFQEEIFI